MAHPILTPAAREEAMRHLLDRLPDPSPEDREREIQYKLDVLAAGPNRVTGYVHDSARVPKAVCLELPPTADFSQSIQIPMEMIERRPELLHTLPTEERMAVLAALERWLVWRGTPVFDAATDAARHEKLAALSQAWGARPLAELSRPLTIRAKTSRPTGVVVLADGDDRVAVVPIEEASAGEVLDRMDTVANREELTADLAHFRRSQLCAHVYRALHDPEAPSVPPES